MYGLYIHIPFCGSRCIYCDFFSTTRTQDIPHYIDCLCSELSIRSTSSSTHQSPILLSSIYLGGGTPSQVPVKYLEKIFNHIHKHYAVSSDIEITMECNPEDINPNYLQSLTLTPINRLSFGIQTFDKSRLSFLHRRHSSEQSVRSIKLCQDSGYENISIDLMYGFPGETIHSWEADLNQALNLDIQHISAYSLSYEKGTPLYSMLINGKTKAIPDEQCSKMYFLILSTMENNGFEHYEISNFAKPGFHSRHNNNYWHGVPYIGIGAGAHSYDLKHRSWNISNLDIYMNSIENHKLPNTIEHLSEIDNYNEYIMTRLRTMEGININEMSQLFSKELLLYFNHIIKKHLDQSNLIENNHHIYLNKDKLFISDSIISDLFKV